jgi:hypothetical protein
MARTSKPKQVSYKGDTYTITRNSSNMATIRGTSGSWTVNRFEVERAIEEARVARDIELENWNQAILNVLGD